MEFEPQNGPVPEEAAEELDAYASEPEPLPEYWPLLEGDSFVSSLKDKEDEWQRRAEEIGIWQIWRIAFCVYHGLDVDTGEHITSKLGYSGSKGQLLQIALGAYRSFARQKNTLMLGERPAFKGMATNSDRSSQTQTEMADTFLSYLYQRAAGEKLERGVGEIANVLGGGYGHCYWDFEAGDDYTADEPVLGPDKQPIVQDGAPLTKPVQKKSGAPKCVKVFPWNLIEEPEEGEVYWRMVKEPNVSKYVLAATFPKHRAAILAGGGDDDTEYVQLGLGQFFGGTVPNKDKGTLRHYYHKRCSIIPDGLYVLVFANAEIYRGPLPIPEGLPIAEMKPSTFFTTKFPYADGWDLLVLQAVINQLLSDEVSNFARFGRASIITEKGTDISIKAMADGGKLFAVPKGTQILPQYLLGGASPAKSGDLRKELDQRMQDQSGLNAIARGDTNSSVTSGTMAALYKDTALEFISADQAEVDSFRTQVANNFLWMVQAYGQGSFLAEVAGIADRPYLREFTREEVSGFKRVYIETSSPILRSIPGRLEMMERIAKVAPEDRGAMIELVETGSTKGFTEDERARDQLIRQENEDLQTGKRPVKASATDPIEEHMRKHRELEDRLRTSEEPDQAALGRVLAHMTEHRDTWMKSDPLMCKLLGIPVPPPIPGTPSFDMQQSMMMGGAPPPGPEGDSPEEPGKPPTAGGPPKETKEPGPSGVPLPKAPPSNTEKAGAALA